MREKREMMRREFLQIDWFLENVEGVDKFVDNLILFCLWLRNWLWIRWMRCVGRLVVSIKIWLVCR